MELTIKRRLRLLLSFVPLNIRYGKRFRSLQKFLEASNHWNKKKISEWQFDSLKEIVYLGYNTTIGYKQLYDENKIKPNDLQKLSDVKFLPVVTKDLLRSNIDAFTSSNFSKKELYRSTTSGSTGIPFSFYQEKRNYFESAFMFKIWKSYGQNPNNIAAVLKGGFGTGIKNIFEYNRYYRSLFLSSHQLNKLNLFDYINILKRYKIKNLRALPSSLYLFCQLLLDIPRSHRPSFETISISSENIYNWQLKLFKKVFPHSTIFSWYGNSEQTVLASQCKRSNKYHSNPFYGFTEIIDKNNHNVKLGQQGKIISTSFHNKATIFIRYDTGDLGLKGDESCKDCKTISFTIDKIIGRDQDFIVGNSGRIIPAVILNFFDDTYHNIFQFQLYQEKRGHVEFKYIPKKKLTEFEKRTLQNTLNSKIGNEVFFHLKEQKKLNKESSGKYKFMVQNLKV